MASPEGGFPGRLRRSLPPALSRTGFTCGRFGAAGSGAPYYSPNYSAYYDGNGLRNQFQDGYEPGQPYHTLTWGPDGVFQDAATSGVNMTFTPGFAQHVGTTDSYTMSDWQGNTRYMPDATGMNFGTYLRYDAFGQRTSATANWYPSPCMYGGDAGYSTTYSTMTGGTWEPGIELQYLEQRYYDPSIGRFISPDPIGLAGGINRYAYADGDPVDGQDPSGLLRLSKDFDSGQWTKSKACISALNVGRKFSPHKTRAFGLAVDATRKQVFDAFTAGKGPEVGIADTVGVAFEKEGYITISTTLLNKYERPDPLEVDGSITCKQLQGIVEHEVAHYLWELNGHVNLDAILRDFDPTFWDEGDYYEHFAYGGKVYRQPWP